MKPETASAPSSTDAAGSAPSPASVSRPRAADHPSYLAWQARMLAGAQRLAGNEDERRASALRLF